MINKKWIAGFTALLAFLFMLPCTTVFASSEFDFDPWPCGCEYWCEDGCACEDGCCCEPDWYCDCNDSWQGGDHDPWERQCCCDDQMGECEPWCECDSFCDCDECGCSQWDEPLEHQCDCGDTQGGLICCFYKLVEEIELGTDTLVFGADITVPDGEWLDLFGVHIETGGYSLIVEGYLFLWPGTVVFGSGVDNAVVEIKSGGYLHITDTAYEDAPIISATGSGGVALAFREGAGYYYNESSFLKINSNDGVGIDSKIPLDLIFYFIDAGNGQGIVSTEETSLFLCRISGGVASVAAPAVFADTSVLVPSNGIYITQRWIHSLSPNRIVLGISESLPETLFHYTGLTAVTFRASDEDDRVIYQELRPDIQYIDTSEPGDFFGMPVIGEWMELCGILPAEETLYTFAVRDLSIPTFQYLTYWSGWFGSLGTASVHFRYGGDDTGVLTCWRSDDEGESWQDATDSHDFYLWEGDLELTLWETGHPVWLVWEVTGVGESEILRVVFDNENAVGFPGGDRSGIDRGENNQLPANGPEDSDGWSDDTPEQPPGDTSGGIVDGGDSGGNTNDNASGGVGERLGSGQQETPPVGETAKTPEHQHSDDMGSAPGDTLGDSSENNEAPPLPVDGTDDTQENGLSAAPLGGWAPEAPFMQMTPLGSRAPETPDQPATAAGGRAPETPDQPATAAGGRAPETPDQPATAADGKAPETPNQPTTTADGRAPETPNQPATAAGGRVPETPDQPAATADGKAPETPNQPAATADGKAPETPNRLDSYPKPSSDVIPGVDTNTVNTNLSGDPEPEVNTHLGMSVKTDGNDNPGGVRNTPDTIRSLPTDPDAMPYSDPEGSGASQETPTVHAEDTTAPYIDGFTPIVIAGVPALLAASGYLIFSLKRRGAR